MKIDLKSREREVLGAAMNKYDKGLKGAQGLLGSLNMPVLHVDSARVNVESIKERLASTSTEVDLPHEFRVCCRDALVFAQGKSTQIENAQEELVMGTSETTEWQHEVQKLVAKLGEQMNLAPPLSEQETLAKKQKKDKKK